MAPGRVRGFPKAATEFAAGEAVYWDAAGEPLEGETPGAAVATAEDNPLVGYAIVAADETATTVRVLLSSSREVSVPEPEPEPDPEPPAVRSVQQATVQPPGNRYVVDGTYRITIGEDETANINAYVTPSVLKTALEALAGVGSGNVLAAVGLVLSQAVNTTGILVALDESLADVPAMTVDTTALKVQLEQSDIAVEQYQAGDENTQQIYEYRFPASISGHDIAVAGGHWFISGSSSEIAFDDGGSTVEQAIEEATSQGVSVSLVSSSPRIYRVTWDDNGGFGAPSAVCFLQATGFEIATVEAY